MSDLPEFKAWAKIPRLSSAGMVVTEKIDGTNAIVHVSNDLVVTAGSRNRWLTDDGTRDNYGFRAWVTAHAEGLKRLGPGYHYGEWWGSGIQRRYGLTGDDKRFSLFNVRRWGPGGQCEPPPCCSVVPVLYSGAMSGDAHWKAIEQLRSGGSVAAPGFMDPEGIVVLMGHQLFKWTFDGDRAKGAKDAADAA